MKLIALFLLALASNAFAIGIGNDNPAVGGINTNVNSAYSGAHAGVCARK